MLGERGQRALLEVRRQFLAQNPDVARSRRRSSCEHGRGTDMGTTVAGLTLCVVLLIGPRCLTEPEIATRRSAGRPRVATQAMRCSRSRSAHDDARPTAPGHGGPGAARLMVHCFEEVGPMIRHARVADGATAPPCQLVSYWCVKGHHTPRRWLVDMPAPKLWECRCGHPAGRDRAHPPEPTLWRPYKSPLAHLLERRSEAECEQLLDEALQRLRVRRGRGRPAAAHVNPRS